MTREITITELRALHAAAPEGLWKVGKNKKNGRVQIYNAKHQVCAVWNTTAHPAEATAKAIAEEHNAFIDILDRVERAEREREEARKENDFMRVRLAESGKNCVYCNLPASDMAKCSAGFPGCARADDLLTCDELTRRDARMKALGAAEWLEAYIDGLSAGNAGAPGSMVAILREEAARIRREAEGGG